MLVLSRKKNQSIVIDGGIEIQVLQVKGGTVKIGVSAPNDVRIVRGELDMYSDMIPMQNEARNTGESDSIQLDDDQSGGRKSGQGVAKSRAGVIGLADRIKELNLEYRVDEPADRVLAK